MGYRGEWLPLIPIFTEPGQRQHEVFVVHVSQKLGVIFNGLVYSSIISNCRCG